MTDEKWRSPNGHSIASDVTDKLPPYTHPENVHTETPNYIHIGDDLLSRIDKMLSAQPDKDGWFKDLNGIEIRIGREEAALIKRALAQQPPVNVELLEWLSDATSIFEWVMYNRDNQDLSHTDFRIKVSEMANDYLSHNIINARAEQNGGV